MTHWSPSKFYRVFQRDEVLYEIGVDVHGHRRKLEDSVEEFHLRRIIKRSANASRENGPVYFRVFRDIHG